jgi:hypothetical protein
VTIVLAVDVACVEIVVVVCERLALESAFLAYDIRMTYVGSDSDQASLSNCRRRCRREAGRDRCCRDGGFLSQMSVHFLFVWAFNMSTVVPDVLVKVEVYVTVIGLAVSFGVKQALHPVSPSRKLL